MELKLGPMANPDFIAKVAADMAAQDAWEASHLLGEICEHCREPKTEETCHGEGCGSEPSADGKIHACKGWSGMCCGCGHDFATGQLP